MRPSTPDLDPTPPATDDVIVEAPTAEQALAEINTRLGPDAAIIEAGKVLRGGLGGFFAREVVQLRARARHPGEPAAAPAPTGDPSRTTTGDGTGLERLLADITTDVDSAERSFADVLRRQLQEPADLPDASGLPRSAVLAADDPVARAAQDAPAPAVDPAPAPAPAPAVAPAPPPPAPAPPLPAAPPPVPRPAVAPAPVPAAAPAPTARAAVPPAEAVAGTPVWSAENLRRLGLPSTLVDAAVAAGAPADDAEWVHRLAAAVAPLCRRLPEGPMILAGPGVLPLADALALPVVTPGCRAPGSGSFAVRGCDTPGSRAWIDAHRAGRWLNVVVGGTGWRALLFADPAAVSFAGAESLPDALQAAGDLGLPLAHGGVGDPDGLSARVNPVDVAIAVRALLPRT